MLIRVYNVIINVAKDFTDLPINATRANGLFSGEAFLEDVLKPAFDNPNVKNGGKIYIILDGGFGYSSAWLKSAFGNLYSIYGKSRVKRDLRFISEEESLLIKEIRKIMEEAQQ